MSTINILAIFGLGPWEIGALAFLALILFGGRLPEVGRSLGKGLVEFKKGIKGIEDDIEDAGEEDDPEKTIEYTEKEKNEVEAPEESVPRNDENKENNKDDSKDEEAPQKTAEEKTE